MTTGESRPPARPKWVKVSLAAVLVLLAVVVVMAIAGGEHGPGRHLPGSGERRTPPAEQTP